MNETDKLAHQIAQLINEISRLKHDYLTLRQEVIRCNLELKLHTWKAAEEQGAPGPLAPPSEIRKIILH